MAKLCGVALLAAGLLSSMAFAGSSRPADTSPPPETTVIATTATPPPVAPDTPTVSTPKPKPVVKPRPATTTTKRPTHTTAPKPVVHTVTPAQTSSPTRSSNVAPAARPVFSPAVRTPARPTAGALSAAARAQEKRAALTTSRDRSAAKKAAELKAMFTNVPKPSYPLTPPGGGAHPRSPIHHFIYLMQENHTFDNYFGTYRARDGRPEGRLHADQPQRPEGRLHQAVPPRWSCRRRTSVTTRSSSAAVQRRPDGRVRRTSCASRASIQPSAMGYYDDRDIPYYWNLADNYVLFDHFFTSAHGRQRQEPHVLGRRRRPAEPRDDRCRRAASPPPTIFDRLETAGVSWKFYVQNYDPTITYRAPHDRRPRLQVVWVPLLGYAAVHRRPEARSAHRRPLSQYYKDLANGTLPAVSYIAPSGSSEHPPGKRPAGETFVRTLISDARCEHAWSSSAFLLDLRRLGRLVRPRRPPAVDAYGYGFRVPALLVSPYARRGRVDHTTLDFTSGPEVHRAELGARAARDPRREGEEHHERIRLRCSAASPPRSSRASETK